MRTPRNEERSGKHGELPVKMAITGLGLSFREAWRISISQRRWREVWRTPLYANSIYLITNSAAGAALGLVFWIVVARLYPAETVGLGSALMSAVGLLVYIAGLGMGDGLIRFLPGAGKGAPALINSVFTISAIVAVAVAIAFLAGLRLWSPTLSFVQGNPVFIAAFIVIVVTAALFSLLDEVFVGLRQAKFILLQNSAQGVVKVVMVVVMAGFFQVFGIFVSWGLAMAVSVVLSLCWFLPRLLPGYRPLPSLRGLVSREMLRFSFASYVRIGLWQSPGMILPLMVVNLLGGEANAYFFVSWGMAALLGAIAHATSISLFAEGSHQEGFLARDVRRSLKFIALLLLPAIVVMLLVADKLLLLFGEQYSVEGAMVLRVLALSTLPSAVNSVYNGIALTQKKLRNLVLIAAAVAFGTLLLSYVLIPYLGILGPGVGWLASHSVIALVLLPTIWKAVRPQQVADRG